MFTKLRPGDEVIIERRTGITVDSPTTLLRRKVDRVAGQFLEVRTHRFNRTNGAGVGVGAGRLLERNAENLQRLVEIEAQDAERVRERAAQAAIERDRQSATALAVAKWLLAQQPEAIVDALGVTTLFELSQQLGIEQKKEE